MSTGLIRHLRGNAIAYVALVLALSGTAYAVGRDSIGKKEIAPEAVGSSELTDNAVKSTDVQDGTLSSADFDDGYCGYAGQILLVGFDYAPNSQNNPPDTLPADGRLLQISQFNELFALYGTTYGGDGQTTFGLPKLDSPVSGGLYIVCINGIFPPRD